MIFVQFSNALAPIDSIVSAKVTVVIAVPLYNSSGIDVNEEGNLYSVRLLQPLNAATPILVILSVTLIAERVLFWNARLPIEVIVSDNSTFPI